MDWDHRCDIVAVLPGLQLAAVDAVVTHASAKPHTAEATKNAGWIAESFEQTKRTQFTQDVSDHATFQFLPLAVETCGYIGKEAVWVLTDLGKSLPREGVFPRVHLCAGQCSCWWFRC